MCPFGQILQAGSLEKTSVLIAAAAASEQVFAAGKQQVEVVVTVQHRPNTQFYIGNCWGVSRVGSSRIVRSNYRPRMTSQILRNLSRHPNAANLYLLGVQYRDENGGDVQAGMSETRHWHESAINNAMRGMEEEAHINVREDCLVQCNEETFNRRGTWNTHTHYLAHVSAGDYQFVPLAHINPMPNMDDRSCKASVYLYGTADDLLPILHAYEPPSVDLANHDPIQALCLIPFGQLESFC